MIPVTLNQSRAVTFPPTVHLNWGTFQRKFAQVHQQT